MKSKIIIGILLLVVLKSFPQTSEISVKYNNRTIGKNIISQNEINANEYIFPKRINESYVDPISGYATLQLRKLSKNGKVLDLSGLIVVFDLETKTVKWTKKIDYSMSNITQYNDIIIFSRGNKNTCLNIENGEPLWEIKNDFYYIDPANKIGLGYKYNGLAGHLHTLEGINMTNGQVIWQKELSREYGWNKIISLNDSTLLVVASGLHSLNIKNGLGWDYNTVTGKKDYKETIAKNVGGIALGVLTGTFITSSGPNLVRSITSNVIIDSSSIYMASKEKLACIDKSTGNIIWSHPLPEESTSKSSLIVKDSLMYLINQGYAYWGSKQIDFGEPFILSLNHNTGKEFNFKTIGQKKNPILDFKIKKDSLLLIFSDSLIMYSLPDGLVRKSKTFEEEAFGNLKFFVGNLVYIKTKDSLFTNVALSDAMNSYVQTSKGKTLVVDNEFNIVNQLDYDDLLFRSCTLKDYKFINKGEQTIILDKNNEPIADIQAPFESFIVGTKLYAIKENGLLEVDLSELINENSQEID